jgi:group I intron endonuclease
MLFYKEWDYKMVEYKKFSKTSGIYCIENLIDGKKYIGKAINLQKRIREHLNKLRINKDESSYLQNAWNKYGEKNFIAYTIEECKKDILKDREIFYIQTINTMRPFGYNLTKGGEGNDGWQPSEETIKNMIDNHWDSSGQNNPMYGIHLFANNHPRFGKKLKTAASRYFGLVPIINGKYKYWQAWVRVYGKRIYIGHFKSEIMAAKVYDKYIVEHGLPNLLNFPEDYEVK